MLFSSPTFFVFFAVYFAFHLVIPRRFSTYLIICGSTVFYAWWRLDYAPLPYVLMAMAYAGTHWIGAALDPAKRRRRMLTVVAVLFIPLIVFKYADFIYRDAIGPLFGTHDRILDLPLPIGISFITFTLTAYVVDTYRGTFPPIRSPATVLAYVLFFPHLIAGPILRPLELIPQLLRKSATRVLWPKAAIAIFTLGLVKKLVVADQIAATVDAIYATANPTGPAAALAIYGFAVQIYCDFSGYTDMAIGLALLLGIRLPDNFRQPYAAASLVEFWRRWHMTLSFWLRDYLYIPLGGNRGGFLRTIRNILITMTLGGLWHGANWTFVLWGFMHGLGISAIQFIRRFVPAAAQALPSWLSTLLTFHFVALGWVLFRARDLPQAVEMLRALISGGSWSQLPNVLTAEIFPVALIVTFFLLHRLDDHRRVKALVRRLGGELVWPLVLLGWVLAITVSQGSSAKFIYFDF